MSAPTGSGVLLGEDGLVRAFVAERLGEGFSPTARAIGSVRGGRLVGGVIYDNYRDGWIEMSCAGEPGWLSKGRLAVIFAYPFLQLGCRGVFALVRRRNAKSRKLVEGLGWRRPYGVPEGFKDDDMVIYTMLRRECRWLEG